MAWLVTEHMIHLLVGFLVNVYVIRYLGPERYGLFSYLVGLLSVFMVLVSMGMFEVIVRDLSAKRYTSDKLIPNVITTQLFVSTVVILSIILFGEGLTQDQNERHIFFILLVSLIFPGSEAIRAYFQYKSESRYFVYSSLIVMLSSSALKVVFVVLEYPLSTFAALYVFETLLLLILLIVIYTRRTGKRISLDADRQLIINLVKDCWPLLVMAISVMIYSKVDQLMIKQLLDKHAVGIYSSALRVAEAWYSISMLIIGSFFPALVRSREVSESIYARQLQYLFDGLFWLSIIAAITASFCADWLIDLLYGQSYAGASDIFVLLMWCGVFMYVGAASGRCYVIENSSNNLLIRTLIGLALNVLGNLFLIPIYGAYGAAISLTLASGYVAYAHDIFSKQGRSLLKIKLKAVILWSLLVDRQSQ